MAFNARCVSEAAYQVSYASTSQFRRDYKGLFGIRRP